MQTDFVTLLVWFFLASNPQLGDNNHWRYSFEIPKPNGRGTIDRKIDVAVHGTKQENTYNIWFTSKEQEVVINATREIDGYKVKFIKPDPTRETFVPFFPTYLGRTWHDDWKLTSIMKEEYPLWSKDARSGPVTSMELRGKDPKDHVTLYAGEKVGLRRLLWGTNDYSIVDVYYDKKPKDYFKEEAIH